MAHLKLSPLQTEILRELINGNRTISELTFIIFHSRYTDEKFETYQSRTRRAVKSLERRGLISKRRIFGRDKPYGLTYYGTAKIVSIIPEMPAPAVFQKWDIFVFPLTILLGVIAWLTLQPIMTNIFSLSLGITIVRSIAILRRVL